jgi:hypothetical protein
LKAALLFLELISSSPNASLVRPRGATHRKLARPAVASIMALMVSACVALGQSGVPLRMRPIESEVAVIGGRTVGAIHIFADGEDRQLDLLAVQYARHSWGGLLTARVDYLAEFVPMLLMHEPAESTPSGLPLTTARRTVYGADITPIGIRLLWLRHHRLKPYLLSTGGVAYFTKNVISPEGARLNFSAEFGGGAQLTLNDRLEMRIGYSMFHVSNGNTVEKNPGLDTNMIYAALVLKLPTRMRH